jgi:Ferric reductase NAD binding domain/FAD-binding domain
MTEKIDTTQFSVLPSGVRMTMNVSKKFRKMGDQGGMGYICLPWISKNQWHAFSLFENPSNPSERQVFIAKCGDWTTQVHRALQRETVRPCYINGPFPSPYNNADAYDNQILVASGIGITPALSVIRAHKNTRRINLIWAVRDESILQFFLQHLYLDHQGWNLIFYTGKEEIRDATIHARTTNTNVCIIQCRPKLNEVIPNIIYGIESGLGLPERYSPDTKLVASEMIAQRYHRRASQQATMASSAGSNNLLHLAEDVACYASELGFHLPTEKVDAMSQGFALDHRIDNDDDFDDNDQDHCAIQQPFSSSSKHHGTIDASARTTDTIMSYLAVGFRPWDRHDDAKAYVKSLDRNLILPTWGMLYCGGAKVVETELKKISDEFHIGLHVESFAW